MFLMVTWLTCSCSVRKHLAPVLKPLMQMVAERTGLKYITLIAGSPREPGEQKCRVACVHYGETNDKEPRNFAKWDPEGFSMHVLGHFGKFLEYIHGKLLTLG